MSRSLSEFGENFDVDAHKARLAGAKADAEKTPGQRRHDEDDFQEAVVQYLELRWSDTPPCVWFHVPNEGKRTPAEAARLARMGLRPGVADFVFLAGAAHGGSWVMELKTATGKLSREQQQQRMHCRRLCVPYVVCETLDEVELVLEARGW